MFYRLYIRVLGCALLLVLGGVAAVLLAGAGPDVFQEPGTWIALAVVAMVSALAAHVAAQRLTRSIEAISRGVQALADGDEQARIGLDVMPEFVAAATAIGDAAHGMSVARQRSANEIEQLTTVLQSMADGVIAIDEEYRVLLANSASCRVLRLSTPDPVGHPLLEVTRCRALYDAVGQALSRPGPLTTDLTIADNPQQHLLLRASQLPGDPCPGVVVVLHDVTEVRRLENIRKEFVANVSHELKTPLASIKAHAETLRMGAVNDPEHNLSFISRIEEDACRLHDLIADMLQIARVESHQQAFNIGPVGVAEVTQKCVSQMAPRAKAKDIQLRVEATHDPTLVLADEEGVLTILANLVDNAIKYTPAGGHVTVRWSEEADSAVLTVEDTGMGIEAELQDRVFERFFRIDRARTRDKGGTGLGLSIVKHLVQAFDGAVSISSIVGHGSRFQVRLPLATPEKAGS